MLNTALISTSSSPVFPTISFCPIAFKNPLRRICYIIYRCFSSLYNPVTCQVVFKRILPFVQDNKRTWYLSALLKWCTALFHSLNDSPHNKVLFLIVDISLLALLTTSGIILNTPFSKKLIYIFFFFYSFVDLISLKYLSAKHYFSSAHSTLSASGLSKNSIIE